MHLGGRHEFSTFRLSLGSVLAEGLGEDEINEEALTAWMHEHLWLVAVPVADADSLGDVETDVLAELNATQPGQGQAGCSASPALGIEEEARPARTLLRSSGLITASQANLMPFQKNSITSRLR